MSLDSLDEGSPNYFTINHVQLWTKLWSVEMMYKLKNKQLNYFTKGKCHDGGGLYIDITRQGIDFDRPLL